MIVIPDEAGTAPFLCQSITSGLIQLSTRHADDSCAILDVLQHHGPQAQRHVAADYDALLEDRSDARPTAVTKPALSAKHHSSRNNAVLTDNAVVPDMRIMIDLGTPLNPRLKNGTTIDIDIRKEFHVILNNNLANVGNAREPPACVTNEPETGASNEAILSHRDTVSNRNIILNHRKSADPTTIPNGRLAYNHVWAYRHWCPQLCIGVNDGTGMNAVRPRILIGEHQAEQLCYNASRLVDKDQGGVRARDTLGMLFSPLPWKEKDATWGALDRLSCRLVRGANVNQRLGRRVSERLNATERRGVLPQDAVGNAQPFEKLSQYKHQPFLQP